MEQIKKVINSSWFKSLAIGIIGIALIAEKHLLYSGIAFGFAIREFLLSLKPECEVCKK
tara:strand:+ start:111 stop:287 length:177 start_codon:yes stop_codon:yes gene_type:complete